MPVERDYQSDGSIHRGTEHDIRRPGDEQKRARPRGYGAVLLAVGLVLMALLVTVAVVGIP